MLMEFLLSLLCRDRPRQEESETPGVCEAARGQQWLYPLMHSCTSYWVKGPKDLLSPGDPLPLRATAQLLSS